MDRTDMIARLMAEAKAGGCELVTLRAIVEEASEQGAVRALDRLGLADAKASAWKAALQWLFRGIMALLLIGIAVRLGVTEVLR